MILFPECLWMTFKFGDLEWMDAPFSPRLSKQAEFPGGQQALMTFLSQNMKYPSEAMEAGIQGRVLVGFVINKDGSVDEVKVVRSAHATLDAEAVRVVKAMPKWKPGKKDGKTVRVRYTLPLTFKMAAPEAEAEKSEAAE